MAGGELERLIREYEREWFEQGLKCPLCDGPVELKEADHPAYTQHSHGYYIACPECFTRLGLSVSHGETYGSYWCAEAAAKDWKRTSEAFLEERKRNPTLSPWRFFK